MSEAMPQTPEDDDRENRSPLPPEAQSRIDDFLTAVDAAMAKANVSGRERRNVIDDLRGQILEMLSQRGQTATAADVEAVLAELDPPQSYAEDAGESPGESATESTSESTAEPAPKSPERPWHGCGPAGWRARRFGWGRRRWWGHWRQRREIAAAIQQALAHRKWGLAGHPLLSRLTETARRAITQAKREARQLNHDYIGTEHVLIGLSLEPAGIAAQVLNELGATPEKIRQAMNSLVKQGTQAVTAERLPLTPRAMQGFALAWEMAQQAGREKIDTEDLLLGQIQIEEGAAARMIQNLGLTLEQVKEAVNAAIQRAQRPREPAAVTFWPPATGKSVAIGSEIWTCIAGGQDTGGAYSMFDCSLPAGVSSAMLRHHREAKAYFVTEGELEIQIGVRSFRATTGSFVSIPKDVEHRISNVTAANAKAIVTVTPSGLEKFLTELGAAPGELLGVAEEYGIELIESK
jgi:quercetin dioxygenase-like cupin family protein